MVNFEPLLLTMSQHSDTPSSEEGRRRVLSKALNITRGTALAPQEYELQLLHQFVLGELTIDQVVTLLEEQENGGATALPGE